MSNFARDASLHHAQSHSVKGSHRTEEGISNEEVYLYFNAIWRGKSVTVTMQADRYAASYFDDHTNTSSDKLTPWRTYASEARYGTVDERGESASGNARAALSKLCEPLVMAWLKSDEYTMSYERAVARMIMRYFDDEHFGHKRVSEALVKFDEVLPVEISQSISATRDALAVYAEHKKQTFEIINNGR